VLGYLGFLAVARQLKQLREEELLLRDNANAEEDGEGEPIGDERWLNELEAEDFQLLGLLEADEIPPLEAEGAAAANGEQIAAREAREAGLEHLLGLRGPIWRLPASCAHVLVFEAAFLGLILLAPLLAGHLVLDYSLPHLMLLLPPRFEPEDEETRIDMQAAKQEVDAQLHSSVAIAETAAAASAAATSKDVLLALAFGYVLFALSCYAWLRFSAAIQDRTLRRHRLVRILTLSATLMLTALKVFCILLLELGAFPLFVGFCLEKALMGPLVTGASSGLWWPAAAAPFVPRLYQLLTPVMVLRWGVGLGFMIFVASLTQNVRKVMRPGVLYFLRDPDNFQPLREYSMVPILRQLRRVAISAAMYAFFVSVLLAAPARCISLSAPGFFPLRLFKDLRETIFEAPALFLLTQVALPLAFDRLQPGELFRGYLAWLIRGSARLVGLSAFLLPQPPPQQQQQQQQQGEEPPAASAIQRFHLRLSAFVGLLCLSAFLAGLLALALPLLCGRLALHLLLDATLNDMYSLVCGLWLVLGAAHAARLFVWGLNYIGRARAAEVAVSVCFWCVRLAQTAALLSLWLGAVPLLIGWLVHHGMTLPMRLAVDQCPVTPPAHYLCLLGLFWLHVGCRLASLFPGGRWAARFDEVRRRGIAQLHFTATLVEVVWPVLRIALLLVAVPTLWRALLDLLDPLDEYAQDSDLLYYRLAADRYAELGMILLAVQAGFVAWLRQRLVTLHDEIRDERYLLRRSLSNVDGTISPLPAAPPAAELAAPVPAAELEAAPVPVAEVEAEAEAEAEADAEAEAEAESAEIPDEEAEAPPTEKEPAPEESLGVTPSAADLPAAEAGVSAQ
jgi:E3 ubiquitin-protein ligase MARCH6